MVHRLIIGLSLLGVTSCAAKAGGYAPLRTQWGVIPYCEYSEAAMQFYPRPCYVRTPTQIIIFVDPRPTQPGLVL